MKVYMVSWNGASPVGGLERVVYYQMEILSKKYDINLITLDDVYNRGLLKKLSRFRKNPVVNAITTSIYVRKLKHKGDMVITHGYNAPFVRADYLFLHGNWVGYENAIGVSRFSIKRIMGLFEGIAGHNAKRMVAVTEYAKQQWIEFYRVNKNKICVLNNCVDTELFKPLERPETETINILFCGRLGHGKGLEKLLELANTIEKGEKYKLIIATPNDWNVELFKGLKNTEIHIGVTIDKLNTFYNSGNVFFFPSLYEGFEMVTTESLSCGIPVIGSRVGAIRELYSKGFEGVDLIENTDVNHILSQIYDLAEKYKTIDKRMELHNRIKDIAGIEVYNKQLEEIVTQRKE